MTDNLQIFNIDGECIINEDGTLDNINDKGDKESHYKITSNTDVKHVRIPSDYFIILATYSKK